MHIRKIGKLLASCLLLMLASQAGSAQEKSLDYFVGQAIQNSPVLKDYQNRLQAIRIDSLRLRAGLGTQVNAVSNNSYAPVISGFGQDAAITNGANLYTAVTASKSVISKHNLQNQLETFELQKQSVQNPARISEQELKKSVIEQYIAAYGFSRQEAFFLNELDLLRKEEVILKKLTSSGIYRQTDYVSFMVLLEQQDLQLNQVQNQYKNAFRTLNYLCGIIDTTVYKLAVPDLKLEKLPELQKSVFYRQFVTDSLNLVVGHRQVDFAYQPKLNLFGDLGYNSSLFEQAHKNFGPNVGLNLSVPIYDGRQRKLLHDQLTVSEETRRHYREFFTRQYGQQVNQMTLQLKDNLAINGKIYMQVSYTGALVEAYRKLLETGEVSVTEYILAIANLLSAKNLLVQNEIEKYQLINQLNYWCREK